LNGSCGVVAAGGVVAGGAALVAGGELGAAAGALGAAAGALAGVDGLGAGACARTLGAVSVKTRIQPRVRVEVERARNMAEIARHPTPKATGSDRAHPGASALVYLSSCPP
jgi:hypothetical protein